MNRFFSGLGHFVVRYRVLVVVVWVLLVLVSAKALPSLANEVNNDNSQFLPTSAPSSLAANLADPILGNANSVSQVMIVGEDTDAVLTGADQAALGREITAPHPRSDGCCRPGSWRSPATDRRPRSSSTCG